MPATNLKTRHFHAHETARYDALSGLPLASFSRRASAILIDFAIIGLIKSPFAILAWRHHHDPTAAEGWSHLVEKGMEELKSLVESVLYFGVALKLGKGQTIGKWLMRIRVLSLTHERIGWWQSIERALGYGASFLEGGFGFIQFYIHRNRMCVHDRIADTIVVDLSKPRLRQAEVSEPEPELAH